MSKKILVVGLTCIDIVNYVNKYPDEDSDSRVLKQVWTAGGNATNNVIVLNQLNSYTHLFSALPAYNQIVEQGHLNEPDLKDLRLAFPDIASFSWVHFEGRNTENLSKMIDYVRAARQQSSEPLISLECEKVREFTTVEDVIKLVDVIFVSKDFARKKGFKSKEEAVVGIGTQFGVSSDATVIVPWAECGVCGRHKLDGELISIKAFTNDEPVIDTLGAGDCFIACCINFLNDKCSLRETLERATRITGKKVRRIGLTNLDIS